MPTVCYYSTSHGYGHAIRSAQVIKALPPHFEVVIRSLVPERLFREELTREFRYRPAEFDCGCLQSDSVTVLARETLEKYAEIHRRNQDALSDEVAFLHREGVDVVVADIPPFPLRVAAQAGIPGIAVANFTWHDIYREYARTGEDEELLAAIAGEYAAASLAMITPMATPTVESLFSRVEHIPIVARKGCSMRPHLVEHVGSPRRSDRLALLYIGLWGLDIDWHAIARIPDWTFVTYEPPPVETANVVVLPRSEWPPADITASVDVVVSKPGSGIISECMANSVPLVYVPRTQFVEYPALVEAIDRWGGGVRIPNETLQRGDLAAALDAALGARIDDSAFATNGGAVAAGIIAAHAG
ncbi:MAG: hypothetical protein ACLQVD_14735 [Capsulimonadaceae bacterium]